ncbi:hypothetical protein ACA910_009669 [Epithemia clementina (nom. ined.)]
MSSLSIATSYTRARLSDVGLICRPRRETSNSKVIFEPVLYLRRSACRMTGTTSKAANDMLLKKHPQSNRSCYGVLRSQNAIRPPSTGSGRTSKFTTISDPAYSRAGYQDIFGISFFAASSAAFLFSNWFSSPRSCEISTTNSEGTKDMGYFPRGSFRDHANGAFAQSSQPYSVMATSSLFLDPPVSLIYQHDVLVDERREEDDGSDGGGRRGGRGDDRAVDSENSVDGVATPKLTVERTNDAPYDLSVRAIRGRRLTMEDTYFVAPGGRFVAVFDGHGGPLVSSYLQQNLYRLVTKALRRKRWEIDDISTTHTSGKDKVSDDTPAASIASHVAALRSAFTEAEEHVLKKKELNTQGSTAVAVWVHEAMDGTRTLVSANVGDSRAILSRQGMAVELTQDHKPNEEREKSRIKRHGGNIEWDALAKVHRVESLSLSRAIGDAYAKPVVSGEVDIKLFPVVEEKDEYLLLASDGLWDVMSSQDVVSYVKKRFETELARKELTTEEDVENYRLVLRRNMARSIVREAVRRGTGDNVCVLIVWLNDSFMASSPSQKEQSNR